MGIRMVQDIRINGRIRDPDGMMPWNDASATKKISIRCSN